MTSPFTPATKNPSPARKTWWSSSMGHAVRDNKSLCIHCCVPGSKRFMKYLSGSGGWLTKWPMWTKQKEILEIRPEYRVKGQLPHLEGGDGKKENGRQILESPRGCGTHQPSEGTFPRTFQAPDVTLCINHQEPPCPTLFFPEGVIGVGENLVKGELGTWPHWAPVQETSMPTGSPGGVTYLIKTRQVTQMSYAALYKDFALFAVTIYKYLHT